MSTKFFKTMTNPTDSKSKFDQKLKELKTSLGVFNNLVLELENKIWKVFELNMASAEKLYEAVNNNVVYKEELGTFENLLSDLDNPNPIGFIKKIGAQSLNDSSRKLLKKISAEQVSIISDIPRLASNQLIIMYVLILENFISDVIKDYYKRVPRSLKCEKNTLKDDELIESLLNGSTLEILIERRVRKLMQGSIETWVKNLQNIGLDVPQDDNLVEMCLIRNCLVHNGNKTSIDLVKRFKNKFKLNDELFIKKEDVNRFKNSVGNISSIIKEKQIEKIIKINSI